MLPCQRRRVDRKLFPAAIGLVSSSLSSSGSSASPLKLPSTLEALAAAEDDRLHRTLAELVNGHRVPWPAKVRSGLAALAPRLSRHSIVRALDLIQPPVAALRLFQWAQSSGGLNLSLDDRAHFKMLQVLCRCRNLSAATDFLLSLDPRLTAADSGDRFFNELIRAYARSGEIRNSIDLFRRMRGEFGVSPSVFSFNSLLSALLSRGRTRSAKKLFEEMTRRESGGAAVVTPDVCTFNILIRGYFLNSMADEAFRLFKEMERWRCKPDLITYNALLDGLCRTGRVTLAHNLLDEMRTMSSDLRPTVVSYTIVIRGYCKSGCVSEALELFHAMASSGIKANRITCNSLLQGLCEAKRTDLIKQLMAQEQWAAFKPDTCTFNTLISAYCNSGCLEDALLVFSRMATLKVKPDSATYSSLIRALCENGDFDRAEDLLDELLRKEVVKSSRAGGCVPLMAAYNPIFDHLCRNGKTSKAAAAFRRLLAKGSVDVACCKILISGHCREGALREAHEIAAEMARRDLTPGEDAYETLIQGFLKKGDVRFAHKTLEKMLGCGHRPKTSTFHAVLAGVLRSAGGAGAMEEACGMAAVMLERKIRPSLELSTALIAALFGADLQRRAFQILGELYHSGYGVKTEELILSLCDSQKLQEARELLLFCSKQQPRQKVDAEVCSGLLMKLCEAGRATDAFVLFQELEEMDLPSSCLKNMEAALEAQGDLRQANFVYRRRKREEIERGS